MRTTTLRLTLIFVSLILLGLIGCSSRTSPATSSTPFSLAVVPTKSYESGEIEMAREKPREFYVVLTNTSKEPQAVWESWNSWGYFNISFEFTTADGKTMRTSRRQIAFTVNFPSTFLVQPGEHQVYAIRLDQWWEANPRLPKADTIPIEVKAIYEVHPTPEAGQYKVWTGRIESHAYSFNLRQW